MCIYKHCVYSFMSVFVAAPVCGGDGQQAAQKEAESRATGQVWRAVGGMGCSEAGYGQHSLNTIHHQPTIHGLLFNHSSTLPFSYIHFYINGLTSP